MIVAEQKPLQAVLEMLRGHRKVLAVGCGTCVSVCFAGGRKEVGVLASALRMARGLDGEPLQVDETSVQRQCEVEYIEALAGGIDAYDAIVSLGCGVGVQYLADRFPGKRVLPALDTKFMGGPTEAGVWEERCQGCGSCILDRTGGVCPISRCAKQLMNGPCGGSKGGRCEVDAGIPCAWQMIWERMEALGRLDELLEIQPPKDWATSRDGGLRRVVREDLRTPRGDAS
ncbi:MAG: methylenetetrahydrofolate reductase C-terminal domain-containing protein [Myxococcales bacterium]|nr:methylenetetrahydrofolate reductase C-terminal domain-containing protein [Myxococcales bacterium]MDH5305991.1 methylenetetrahydrofolate reductase C-terminal domain-containing protein [Myxococcales bacterium]MDH5565520.1 methylenetetrahydrofolate reductase C-terminal domain-containing protein [Myxococcales bacterium]